MELTFYFLLILSLMEVALLGFLAHLNPLDIRGKALHPYNVLGFLFVIVDIDFLSLFFLTKGGVHTSMAESMIVSLGPVVHGFTFYFVCQSFVIVGIAAVALPMASSRLRDYFVLPSEVRATHICMLLCVAATVFALWQLIVVSLQNGSFTYIAGVRQRFFAANPFLLVIVSTVAPAYILYGSRNRLRAAAFALIPLLPFLALAGGRSKLLYPLIAFLYWVCRRVRMSIVLIYLGAPALLLALSMFTFISRQSGALEDFPRYLQDNGGLIGSLFDQPSISMAEIISINVDNPVIERRPWESLLGGVLLPIPRSIVTFKPQGASTQFTQTINSRRWELVKSEWTITGFVNLMYDFGTFGAYFVCILLGALWSGMLQRASRSRFGTSFVGPVSCLVAYQFIRGDLYIVAQFLWPLLFVTVIYRTILVLLRLFRRPSRQQVTNVVSSGASRRDLA
jgi:hypothetical protein